MLHYSAATYPPPPPNHFTEKTRILNVEENMDKLKQLPLTTVNR